MNGETKEGYTTDGSSRKKIYLLENATYIVDIINLTFTVVLIREGHKVPSRKGASLPCNPVIHMILPI